jgi:hypothetical protein
MIDPAVAELMKQGLGFVLFIFSCGVIALLWRNNGNLQKQIREIDKASDAVLLALQEKRLAEMREVVLAIERSAASALDHTAAMSTQATAINDLTKGFAALVLTSENGAARFKEAVDRLEARQEAILSTMGKTGHAIELLIAKLK